jgi:hypothetical protein
MILDGPQPMVSRIGDDEWPMGRLMGMLACIPAQ